MVVGNEVDGLHISLGYVNKFTTAQLLQLEKSEEVRGKKSKYILDADVDSCPWDLEKQGESSHSLQEIVIAQIQKYTRRGIFSKYSAKNEKHLLIETLCRSTVLYGLDMFASFRCS